jgi:hypothetical protein
LFLHLSEIRAPSHHPTVALGPSVTIHSPGAGHTYNLIEDYRKLTLFPALLSRFLNLCSSLRIFRKKFDSSVTRMGFIESKELSLNLANGAKKELET